MHQSYYSRLVPTENLPGSVSRLIPSQWSQEKYVPLFFIFTRNGQLKSFDKMDYYYSFSLLLLLLLLLTGEFLFGHKPSLILLSLLLQSTQINLSREIHKQKRLTALNSSENGNLFICQKNVPFPSLIFIHSKCTLIHKKYEPNNSSTWIRSSLENPSHFYGPQHCINVHTQNSSFFSHLLFCHVEQQ